MGFVLYLLSSPKSPFSPGNSGWPRCASPALLCGRSPQRAMHCPYWSLPELLCMPLCLFTGHRNGGGVQKKLTQTMSFPLCFRQTPGRKSPVPLMLWKVQGFLLEHLSAWNQMLQRQVQSSDFDLLWRKTFSRSGISGYSRSSQRRCFLSWALSIPSGSCCRATPVCVLAQSYLPGSGSKQRYFTQEYWAFNP